MIRYDAKLTSEINRTVRNFNAKIKRLRNSNPYIITPEIIRTKDLKSSYSSRKLLKQRLYDLQKFSKRGAEDIVLSNGLYNISRWEMENLTREQKRITRSLAQQIRYYGQKSPTTYGRKEEYTYSMLPDDKLSNLMSRLKAIRNYKRYDVDLDEYKRLSILIQKTRDKDSYVNTLFQTSFNSMELKLGYAFGVDSNKIKYIESRLSELSTSQFNKLYDTEQSLKALRNYYIQLRSANVPYEMMESEVKDMFDNLYDNIDVIVNDYKKQ